MSRVTQWVVGIVIPLAGIAVAVGLFMAQDCKTDAIRVQSLATDLQLTKDSLEETVRELQSLKQQQRTLAEAENANDEYIRTVALSKQADSYIDKSRALLQALGSHGLGNVDIPRPQWIDLLRASGFNVGQPIREVMVDMLAETSSIAQNSNVEDLLHNPEKLRLLISKLQAWRRQVDDVESRRIYRTIAIAYPDAPKAGEETRGTIARDIQRLDTKLSAKEKEFEDLRSKGVQAETLLSKEKPSAYCRFL